MIGGARLNVSFGIVGSGQETEGMPDPGLYRELAACAEAVGYDSLWSNEHISFRHPILEATTMLAAFASLTRRIRVGTSVLLLPLRHPGLVAKQVASIDYLAGGRVILGIGVGGEGERDFQAVEVPAGERGSRTNDSIAALRKLWSGAPASHHGPHFNFDGISIQPQPARAGGPPIWVGGRSDAAIRRAGLLGDGWLPYLLSTDRFRTGLEAVRRHADGAGRDPDLITPAVMLPTRLDDDRERARADALEHLRQRYGGEYGPHLLDRYCLVGNPDDLTRQLRGWIDAGARHIIFNPAGFSRDRVSDFERLHRLVVSPFKESIG